MEHDPLIAMLNRLKLTAIRDQLDSLVDEAAQRDLTIREALSMFCEREISRKDERRIEMSVGLARFPFVRDLDDFDFAAQPSIDKKQIRELTGGRFIANADAVLLLGPPGVGNPHLAVAIGRQALLAGYTVLFAQAPTLVAQLAKAHSEGRLEDRLTHFGKPKLLIVDELGYLPFEPNAAHLFFQLVSRRYERGSMLITSNRSIGEWGTVFGDAVVATAILDRLLHHSHVLTIRGDSYRLREKRRTGLLKAPPIAPSVPVPGMTRSLPRWVHRNLPRAAPPDSWRSLRSARVPPVHYLDKPPRPSLGATSLTRGVQFSMSKRVQFRTSVDTRDSTSGEPKRPPRGGGVERGVLVNPS